MIHLCHISTKQKEQQQPASVAFCSTAPFMHRHFFPRRCLVDQGCAALLGASIEEFSLPLSDAPPLLDTLLLHRSKASGEFIKRNYSEKKRKRRRGSRCMRCSSEQIRWLSNIGRKDKQKAKRTHGV